MEREPIDGGALAGQAGRLAEEDRTIVHVGIDGRRVGLIAIADAPRLP